jgi:cephalosporin hydroxylase
MITRLEKCISLSLDAQLNASGTLENHPLASEWFVKYCGVYYSPYYTFMYYLGKEFNPELSLELGVEQGRGLAALASGTSNDIIGVDVAHASTLNDVLNKYKNITFFKSTSTSIAIVNHILSTRKRIGLLHFDTAHTYDQVMNEYRMYKSVLAEDAILLFDDTHAADDSVLKAVNELPLKWRKHEDRLHPICGYAVGLL